MQQLHASSTALCVEVPPLLDGLSVCLQLIHPLVPPTHLPAPLIHPLALPTHQPHLVSCPSYLSMQAAYALPATKSFFSVNDTAYVTHSCTCLQSICEWRTVFCAWRPDSTHIYAVTPIHVIAMQHGMSMTISFLCCVQWCMQSGCRSICFEHL